MPCRIMIGPRSVRVGLEVGNKRKFSGYQAINRKAPTYLNLISWLNVTLNIFISPQKKKFFKSSGLLATAAN